MEPRIRRFACTQCGKCCDRSPEVELSEAAALSDVFVFCLMFRVYRLPRAPGDYFEGAKEQANASKVFYQSKRLLGEYAARKSPTKVMHRGKTVEYTRYLTISALTLDTGSGACSALAAGRCNIYDRRPFSCRSAPFHYSRVEASAESCLDGFVRTPGYGCDTSGTAPIVLEAGRIVDKGMYQARSDALTLARRDGRWKMAILRRVKAARSDDASLPSLQEIEANAPFGATTTSMRIAWQIAAEAGLMSAAECKTLIATQAAVIERELTAGAQGARQTLVEMRAEYGQALKR